MAGPVSVVLWALVGGTGCGYKVKLTSSPAAAQVRLPDQQVVYTPAVVRLRWVPFGSQRVIVSAPGHRPLTVDLRDREIRLGRYLSDAVFHPSTWRGAPRGEVELVLVPLHGPVGTWEAEELP